MASGRAGGRARLQGDAGGGGVADDGDQLAPRLERVLLRHVHLARPPRGPHLGAMPAATLVRSQCGITGWLQLCQQQRCCTANATSQVGCRRLCRASGRLPSESPPLCHAQTDSHGTHPQSVHGCFRTAQRQKEQALPCSASPKAFPPARLTWSSGTSWLRARYEYEPSRLRTMRFRRPADAQPLRRTCQASRRALQAWVNVADCNTRCR